MNLVDLLNQYNPMDLYELDCKQKMLDLLETHSNCFERSCRPGHFTASCWLLDKNKTKFLLMHHAKLNKWLQLGGHCDGNSDVLSVAIQEAKEESGINQIVAVSNLIFDLDIHMIPSIAGDTLHYHYDVRFLLQVKSDDKVVRNHESKDIQWFSIDVDNLPTDCQSVLKMHNKYKALVSVEPIS